MLNLIRSKNTDLKRKSYDYADSLFYYLDHYEVPYTSYSQRAGFIVIELINIFETGTVINFLNCNELNNLRDGKQKLLLFYPKEPVSHEMLQSSLCALNEYGIENSNIVLITGEHGRSILNLFPSDLTVIPYFFFDMSTSIKYKGREDISRKPKQKFLCYNGTVKLHRTLLYEKLQNNKDGFISYLKRIYNRDIVQYEIDNSNLSAYKKIVAQNISFTASVELDLTLRECIRDQFQGNHKLYEDTAFSIVTESLSTPGSLFVTEKTFKAILSMHPFIIAGSPGILKFVKQFGYSTFDFLIDESYDDILDLEVRLGAIEDVVNKFDWAVYNGNKDKIFNIAKRNRDRCVSTNYKLSLCNLLRKIEAHENTIVSA